MRQCGDCQLCCRLLPVPPLGKKAGEKCQHQKFGKGCKVYRTPAMPSACALWNCRWLVNDGTENLSRPDRSHYVIDIMPDFIRVQNNETGERYEIQVVQIWIDPAHPLAHRDPALRAYLLKLGERGIAALIRYDNKRATTLLPPNMVSGDTSDAPAGWLHVDGFVEIPYNDPSATVERQHSFAETMKVLSR